MTQSEFFCVLAEVFQVEPAQITPTTEFQQLAGWSSLMFLDLLSVVDEELGVTLSPAKILACQNVSDLTALLGDKIVDANRVAA